MLWWTFGQDAPAAYRLGLPKSQDPYNFRTRRRLSTVTGKIGNPSSPTESRDDTMLSRGVIQDRASHAAFPAICLYLRKYTSMLAIDRSVRRNLVITTDPKLSIIVVYGIQSACKIRVSVS